MRQGLFGGLVAALVALSAPALAQNTPATTAAAAEGLVTLNFPNADVHEVAKAILGDMLGLNYAVDPAVHGTVTVVTAQPVARDQVLLLFEASLKASNMTLVHQGNLYSIDTLDSARKGGQLVDASDPGFGTEAVQLHYVSATQLKKLIDPIVPDKSISQADAGRNVLLVTGSGDERRAVRELAMEFDVDWMRNMAFALFTPQRTDAKTLATELDQVLNGEGSPTAGIVHIIPLERMNGILAISKQPAYLAQVRRWVARLDQEGHEGERRLFVYRVQNGRAADLAAVLVNAFGGSARATTPTSPLAVPGSATGSQPVSTAQPVSPIGTASSSDNSNPTGLTGIPGTGITPTQPGAPLAAQTLLLGNSLSPVTISSDENNNAIIIYATPAEYRIVQDALHNLDAPPMQVMIEAAIAEVTLTDDLKFGVQWSFQDGDSHFALSNARSGAIKPLFPGFSYLISNGSTINATLSALSQITDVKVVSAPKLFVLNNHTAALQVGDEVPIATQSAVGVTTADAPIVNSIQYQPTGVILNVTPRVNDSGLVLLDISQQVSDVASTSTSQIDSPTISNRQVTTSVAVQDGHTIALGGLIRDSQTHTKSGLPFLSDIPIVGNLFGTTDDNHTRTELIILLTPHVARNGTDAEAVTEELRAKMRSIAPPQILELPPPAQ